MNKIKLDIEVNQLQENSQEDPRDVTGVNQDTLLVLLGCIQKYAPEQNLNTFIRQVDTLMEFLEGKLTPDSEFIVIFSIKSKILGEARDFLTYQCQRLGISSEGFIAKMWGP